MDDDNTLPKHTSESTDPPLKAGNEPALINLFAATGAAIFRGAERYTIKPQQGETKRTFRLLRLLMCLVLGIAGLVVAIGFLHLSGTAVKYLGALIAFGFAIRCFFVTARLWERLR